MQCEDCEPAEEAEAEAEPAAQAKVRGAKAVPPSWATTPSVAYPKRGQPKLEGVRYHIEDEAGNRTYWGCKDGRHRWPVCVCQDEGKCGLRANSKTRPGYAWGCATREDRKEACNAARGDDGALPASESQKAHKGHEQFVFHKGRECVTKPGSGEAKPLCKCGACFLVCQSFQHEFALGCVHNPAPPCATTGCPNVVQVQGYCGRCSKRTDAVAQRKAERDHELQALLAQHGIARAPEDIHEAEAGTPYGHQNPHADYAPRIVVRTTRGKGGFKWASGCTHVGDDGTLCAQQAHLIPGGPVKCRQHGGGHRCVGFTLAGSNPEPCPYDISIQNNGKGKYGDHCVRCFIASYPNDVRAVNAKRYLKAKELAVREFLEAAFPDYKWSFDRAFAVGVKERPDALTRTRDRILIVEIDEHSHDREACGKEREREAIFQRRNKTADIVMIRFNPDAYVDLVTGKKVPSCFHVSPKENLVTVHPKHKAAWAARLATLATSIRMCIDPTHPDYLEVLPPKEDEGGIKRAFFSFELFYDNIHGMTEAQQEARRTGRVDGLKRAAQKRKAEAEAAAESDSD